MKDESTPGGSSETTIFLKSEIEACKSRNKSLTHDNKLFWINDGMLTAYNNVLRLIEPPAKRTIAQALKRIADNKRKA
jgi:hypothetical protein